MDLIDTIRPPVAVGDRLVLRTLLPDGSATDVLGWVTELADRTVTLHGLEQGSTVLRTRVVAGRRLSPAVGGPGPARTRAEELEQIALPGWVAVSEPLGEWTLRAGGGFTGRANSCLAVGDPGVDLPTAAARVVAFAAAHAIPPRAQVVADSPVEQQLRSLGWTEVYVPTDVLAVRLNTLLGDRRADPQVAVRASLDDAWWAAYQVSRPNQADPVVLRAILNGRPPLAFAALVRDAQHAVAIGRAHVHRSWMGLTALWTEPEHRRRGHATAVMTALGHWAARQGARNVYLQVATDNRAAHQAYERSGFTVHHSYRYLAPA